ncbi:alpha/beta hydrolase family protein [Micromonospora sonneratiae]|uniref:Alpha/beta hydrolase family protein n=1 Tax=Micromonospora sonneratiae TaxID=1184706 RepID=A0ABW3YDJ0_9ACTN
MLTDLGIVTLIYDKRVDAYQYGDQTHSVLASDAIAGVQLLRKHAGVDPGRVGLFGVSEGGWVAPLAASRSNAVAFLITVAASGVSPARQEQWHRANQLDHAGIRGSLARVYSETFWRQLVAADALPAARYDPVPVLERVLVPVLALWGEYDRRTPPAESLTIFREAFERTGHKHYTLRVLPGADHVLRQTPDRGYTRGAKWVPGYPNLVRDWLDGLRTPDPVAVADAPPMQDRVTIDIRPLGWYESIWVQISAALLALAGFGYYLLVGLGRRLNRRPSPMPPPPARWLASAGTLGSIGVIAYFAFLTATVSHRLGPVLAGRPIPWLLLQALAMVTVASLLLTVYSTLRRAERPVSGERVRLAVLLGGAGVFVSWAAYWGLLLP